MKTVVIGSAGAGSEPTDAWIKERALSNIARGKREGVRADMKGVLPRATSPNWQYCSIGKKPGKLLL
jgi:hypothetical protein